MREKDRERERERVKVLIHIAVPYLSSATERDSHVYMSRECITER